MQQQVNFTAIYSCVFKWFFKQMFEVGLLKMFEIRIKYNYLEDSLSLNKILAPLMTWVDTNISRQHHCNWKIVFSILLELHVLAAPAERTCHSFHSYSSLRLTHDMILPFSNNCDDKKFILLSENFQNRFSSSVLM